MTKDIPEQQADDNGESLGRWQRLSRFILAKLARETSSGRFIVQIDGLRFFAIASVILFHIGPFEARGNYTDDLLSTIYKQGFVGVQLFFAISGFILFLPFAEQYLNQGRAVSLRKYYVRRVTRIEPTYFLSMLILFLPKVKVMGYTLGQGLMHLLACFTYTHWVFFTSQHPQGMINAVGWSLEVEVQFYVLAPLLSKLFLIRPTVMRRAVIVAAMALFAWVRMLLVPPGEAHGLPTLLTEINFFLVGFLLADLYVVNWKSQPTRQYHWDLFSTVAWLAIYPCVYLLKLNAFVLPAIILVAYIGAFRSHLWNAITSNLWVATIGGMCYTTYLYHYNMIYVVSGKTANLVPGLTTTQNVALHTVFLFPLVIGASAVLFLLFEKPFMRRNWPIEWRDTIRRVLHIRPEPVADSVD